MPAATAPLSGRTISNDQSLQRNNSEPGNRSSVLFVSLNLANAEESFPALFEGDANSGQNAWTWHHYGYRESRVSALCPYKCLEAGWKTSWHMQGCRATMRLLTMQFHSHQERGRCMALVNLPPCVCTSCACSHPVATEF